jgi:hypothetical protein
VPPEWAEPPSDTIKVPCAGTTRERIRLSL